MFATNSLMFSWGYGRAELFTRKVWRLTADRLGRQLGTRLRRTGYSKRPRLLVTLWHSENGNPITLSIWLIRQPCHLGGYRWWIECPRCRRRVGALYLVNEDLACRTCLGLKYLSQNCSDAPTLMHHYARLREELEHRPGPKPKRYWRCLAKEDLYVTQVMHGLVKFSNWLRRRGQA